MYEKIKSFSDLFAWRKAHKLALDLYIITKKFPREEKYGLVNQIKRASVSITSNIAEGFSRRTSIDKKHFYYNALASLTEVQNQLILARDLHYLDKGLFNVIANDSISVHKLINGLIKSSTTKSS